MSISAISLTRTQKNHTLGLMVLGHGVGHWYNGMLTVLYPVLTVALGLSYSQVGLFDSSRGIIAVITSLAGGYLADTIGQRRWFLGLCLMSLGVFTALLGFAQTFVVALLWLALGGIGNSLWHPYAIPLLNTIFPRRRSLALALHDAGANIFHGLSPVVVGMLLGLFTWQFVTHLHLWPGVLMGGLILLTLPSLAEPRLEEQTTRPNYRQALRSGILRNRPFLLASSVSICLTMGRLGLFTFIPLFLAFELDLNSATQGLYMGVLTFSGALLAPGVGTLADRVGVRLVLSSAMLMACVLVIILAFTQFGLVLFVVIAILGSALFSTRSLILVYAMSVTPEELGGSSIGAIFSLNRLFGILSPIIAGLIADSFGLRSVFYFFGFLLFMGGLLTFALRRQKP